jgi:predicted nucleotidyltransferase
VKNIRNDAFRNLFFNSPLYLQSVPIYSANAVKSCTKACRRVLTSTHLYLIGSKSFCDLGIETYKLNLKNYIYNYNNYILNLVGGFIEEGNTHEGFEFVPNNRTLVMI